MKSMKSMKKRKFAEGGTTALDELVAGRDKGAFDQDVYARAKRFLERGGEEAPARSPAAAVRTKKSAPASPVGRPRGGDMPENAPAPAAARRAEIPSENYPAPESTGDANEYGEVSRNILNTLSSLGGLGGAAAGLRLARGAKKVTPSSSRALAETETPLTFLGRSGRRNITPAEQLGVSRPALPAPRTAIESAAPKAIGLSKESVNRAAAKKAAEGPYMSKQEKELLESTLRGRASRADIQAKRAAREDASPEFKRGGKVKSYASGGSVRGGGCEARGKTKGRMV